MLWSGPLFAVGHHPPHVVAHPVRPFLVGNHRLGARAGRSGHQGPAQRGWPIVKILTIGRCLMAKPGGPSSTPSPLKSVHAGGWTIGFSFRPKVEMISTFG